MTLPLIFSDLDGTLLDYDSYSFAAARTVLAEINRRGYPLILASSKTAAEMQQWHERLALSAPFICENGAAVFSPRGPGSGWDVDRLAPPRDEILEVLAGLCDAGGYHYLGFADCTAADVAELTGLAPEQAGLALEREFSEPVQWRDSAERLAEFRQALAQHSLQALQGGRFVTVSGHCDKATAMSLVRERYAAETPVRTIALGNSPNDESMLAAADIAVIINSRRADDMYISGPAHIIRTTEPGPAGWQEAMLGLLDSLAEEV